MDMQMLYETFAMKTKPDDTINRIKALEAGAKDMLERHDKADSLSDDLSKRLGALETKVNGNHEDRITALEKEIQALKDAMSGMGSGNTGEGIDTAQIMMRINMISVEVNKKIDVVIANGQMDSMNNNLKETIAAMAKQMERN